MAEASIEAVLFDIDGTLISSGGASHVAWERAFQEIYGVSAGIDEYTNPGMTDPEVGRLAFVGAVGHEPSRHELAKVMGRRLKHLADAVEESDGYRVLDGVEELLDRLVDSGLLLGLTTGNVEAAAHIKLGRGNLNRFFCFGGYGSDSTDRTELTRRAIERGAMVSGGQLDKSECFSVGDTPLDIQAGHGAGIRVAGVATGKFSAEELREAGADWALLNLTAGFPV